MPTPHTLSGGGATLLLATLLTSAPAGAAGLTIDLAIGGFATSLSPSGLPIGGGGSQYVADILLPGADATIEVLAKPGSGAMLSGTIVLTSTSLSPVSVELTLTHTLDAPIAHPIWRRSLGGMVPFGGGISSQPGVLMHEVLANGIPSPGLLPAGYSSSGDVGPLTALNHAAMTGAPAANTMGQRWRLILTPGTTVALNAVLRLDTFDLDGNGSIGGGDIGALLARWGQPGAGDFNLDGVVDSADLGLLLADW